VHLDASAVFPLPGDGRKRSFALKNISFEDLGQTDLYTHGWHKSGYLFDIHGADTDGWVDKRLDLSFPATQRFKEAIVQVVRYPSDLDFPLDVSVNGASPARRTLGLGATETVRIPLSAADATSVRLQADRTYPLAAPDTRQRSYRVVNIDFD
jgi:hypothetical protein